MKSSELYYRKKKKQCIHKHKVIQNLREFRFTLNSFHIHPQTAKIKTMKTATISTTENVNINVVTLMNVDNC